MAHTKYACRVNIDTCTVDIRTDKNIGLTYNTVVIEQMTLASDTSISVLAS